MNLHYTCTSLHKVAKYNLMQSLLTLTKANVIMDIEQFVKKHKPRMRTSKLDKYVQEIKTLKDQKFTDEQIREWLATNEIQVSREAVRQFVKKVSKDGPVTVESLVPNRSDSEPNEVPRTLISNESQADKLRRKLAEQQSEADKTRFKHDKSGNTN
jgi:hypothetical protein